MNCPDCGAHNDEAARSCLVCGYAIASGRPRLEAGVVFAARYELIEPLGKGGMGMVYKARDRNLDELVALKLLRPDLASNPELQKRFRSEIRLARRIRHRNVCSIFGDGEDAGTPYICMELVEGVDLKRLIRSRGGLGADEAFEIAIQAAEGLGAIHESGIIHRDLKAANIMRDARGVVRLMDFGLARSQLQDSTGATGTGQVIGTPDYMSPEQARGLPLDVRSDVYSLAVVVFELFTGDVPFRGDTPLTTLMKHLHDAPPLTGEGARRLPEALVPVLKRALAKDPRQRQSTAAEFAEALRRARAAGVGVTRVEAPTVPAPRAEPASADTLGASPTQAATLLGAEAPPPEPAAGFGAKTSTWKGPLAARPHRGAWLMLPAGAAALGVLAVGVLLRSNSMTGARPAPGAMATTAPGDPVQLAEVVTAPAAGPAPAATAAAAPARPLATSAPPATAAAPPAMLGPAVPASSAPVPAPTAAPARVLGRLVPLGTDCIGALSGLEGSVVSGPSPDFVGQFEFDVRPSVARAGEAYSLRLFFTNTASTPMAFRELAVQTRVNAEGERRPVRLNVDAVEAGKRALLWETSGTWGADVRTWVMLVSLVGARHDTCSARLALRQDRG